MFFNIKNCFEKLKIRCFNDNNKTITTNNNSPNVINNYQNCIVIADKNFTNDILKNHQVPINIETKLRYDYATNSIDMEQEIKEIYKKCFKICVYNSQDEQKYRIIKNLIDIVPKLTSQNIKYFQGLIESARTNNTCDITNSTLQLNHYGLLNIIVNNGFADEKIKEILINQIPKEKSMQGLCDYLNQEPEQRMQQITNTKFIKLDIIMTAEGKLLNEILKIQSNIADITVDDINKIIQFLNKEINNL